MCVRCSQDESHGIFNKLHTHFSAKGYEVFNPSAAFKKTRPTKQAMADAVAGSQLVIAALSKEFFKSKWCQAEIVAAQKAGITVQPVYAGDFISNQQMEGWVAAQGIPLITAATTTILVGGQVGRRSHVVPSACVPRCLCTQHSSVLLSIPPIPSLPVSRCGPSDLHAQN